MGVAYGAADGANASNAKRIAVIIGPDGKVKEFVPKADTKTFPVEALTKL